MQIKFKLKITEMEKQPEEEKEKEREERDKHGKTTLAFLDHWKSSAVWLTTVVTLLVHGDAAGHLETTTVSVRGKLGSCLGAGPPRPRKFGEWQIKKADLER